MGDIRVETAKVRSTGDDMKALASDTQRRLSHVLDSSQEVYYDAMFWKSGNAVMSCRTAWQDHMVDLAKRMGELGSGCRTPPTAATPRTRKRSHD